LRKNGPIIAIYCSGKFFWPLKWYTDRNFFGDGGGGGVGGGGRRYKFVPKKKFSEVVGDNPKTMN
jgi:hypothetical protein